MFDHKDRDQRIDETINFIAGYTNPPGDLKNLVAVLKAWQSGATFANERKRVSDAMHQGPFGSENDRGFRRATILLRTAVLRHDSSKAEREVNLLDGVALRGHFEAILRQCANHAQVVPPFLEALRASAAAKASKDELQTMTRKLVQNLGGTSAGWLTTLKNNQGNMNKSQKKLYEDWEAKVARSDQLTQNRRAAKYLYLPVPSDNDTAIRNGQAKFNQEVKVVKCGAGGLDGLKRGGELFVLGHGNFGVGVGTHDEHLGAVRLATSLDMDKLPKSPDEPIWIYLYVCWTATHTRRAWGGQGKREPYARRLARAMSDRGFEDHYLVGFAGSVGFASAASVEVTVSQKLDVVNGSETPGQTQPLKDSDFSVYKLTPGNYNRVAGEDWTSKAAHTWNPKTDWDISVVRRGG
jgi:hypothetical protein